MDKTDPVLERLDRANRLLERMAAVLEAQPQREPAPPAPLPPPSNDALWDVKRVAEHLRCSTSKVYKDAEAGLLPCVRCGRSLRFKPDDIRTYVNLLARRQICVTMSHMKRDAVLNLRIPRDIKDALQRAADQHLRTMSSMATWALSEWLTASGHLAAIQAEPKQKKSRRR